MLMCAVLPWMDYRPFTDNYSGRIERLWPAEEVNPGANYFVHGFGQVIGRGTDPDAGLGDERSYVRANRAIRFPGLTRAGWGAGTKTREESKSCMRFRRMLTEKCGVLYRMEVGVDPFHGVERPFHAEGFEPVIALAGELAALASTVPVGKRSRGASGVAASRPLMEQGRPLAQVFARVTTKRHMLPKDAIAAGRFDQQTVEMVEQLPPLVLVQCVRGEVAARAASASGTTINPAAVQGAQVHVATVGSRASRTPVWILTPGDADDGVVRTMRMALIRLMVERSAALAFLRRWEGGQHGAHYEAGTRHGRSLREFVETLREGVDGDRWANLSAKPILDALAMVDAATPGRDMQLSERLAGALKQMDELDQDYQRRMTVPTISIGGDNYGPIGNTIHAKVIKDAFNNFAGAKPSDDLKKAMGDLHSQVTALLEKTPKEQEELREEVTNQLKAFTDQAAAKKPLKGVLEVTGKGLIAAATAVAGMAAPIGLAVKAVLAALGMPLPGF